MSRSPGHTTRRHWRGRVSVVAAAVLSALAAAGVVVATPQAGDATRRAQAAAAPHTPSLAPHRSTPRARRPARRPGKGRVQLLSVPFPPGSGQHRKVWVYRPGVPDSRNLPVVYFLHGLPGSATDLARAGIVSILDREFTSGRSQPYVLVCPDGNSPDVDDPEWSNSSNGQVQLETFVTTTLVDAVEGANRRDRAHRMIVGFSMGGFGATNIALRHTDEYSALVSVAGYFHLDDPDHDFGTAAAQAANSPDQHAAAARGLRVLLADGSSDSLALTKGESQRFAAMLQRAGVDVTLMIRPGQHSYQFVTSIWPQIDAFLTNSSGSS